MISRWRLTTSSYSTHTFADVEVVPLNADLRLFNGLADHAMLDRFVFGEAGCLH